LASSQAHPWSVIRSTAISQLTTPRVGACPDLRAERAAFMNLAALAGAGALIACAVPALGQTEAEPPAALEFPGTPAEPSAVVRWRVLFSPYTWHFSYDAAHKPVVMLGLERERPDGIVLGGTVFSNSFGQPSVYAFGGQRLYGWSPWKPLFAEWTAGLLYGYTGEYQHKVPLNYKGFSPGIVAGLGWQFSPVIAGQLNLLGTSGLMFQISIDVP